MKDRYDKEYLVELYQEHGSIGKIAAFLGKSYGAVSYWCHKHDIEVQPSCMTIFRDIQNTPMSEFQKSVVLGSVLGDGCLKLAPHSKNARLVLGHSVTQLQYLTWKNEILKPFSRGVKLDQKAKTKMICGQVCHSKDFYRCWTIAHPDVTSVYKRYVKNHKKCVSSDVIDELDLIALSIWFADDGSVYTDKRNGGMICSLATNSFSYKEQLVLVEALRRFFKGTIKIDKQGNVGRTDLYLRLFKTKCIIQFLTLIKSVLPECIHYKLGPQRLGVKPLK